jgi:hypothetical protein
MPLWHNKGRFGTLELQARSRIIIMKKAGKQTQLANMWQDSFVKSEPAVRTIIVNSYSLLKSIKKF